MGFYDDEELIDPSPAVWLEFRLLDPPPSEPAPPSSDPATLAPPWTFPLFTSLPAEIRLQIYAESLHPRTILLTCKTSSPDFSTFPSSIPDATTTQRQQPQATHATAPRFSCPRAPALLHVSRETRTFALERYKPSFGYHISPLHTSTPLRLPPRVFFDFARDSLLLSGELEPRGVHGFHAPMVYFLDKAECSRVGRVACRADALRCTAPPSAPLPPTTMTAADSTLPNGVVVGAERDAGRVEVDDEVVFVMLSHVLDRFSGVDTLLVPFTRLRCSNGKELSGAACWEESGGDAIQKIWDGWVLGVTASGSSLRGKRIPLVREEDLEMSWVS